MRRRDWRARKYCENLGCGCCAMAKIVPAVPLFATTLLLVNAYGSSAISQCRSSPTQNDINRNLLPNENDTAVDFELDLLLNQTNANGSAVVLQAIGALQQSGVFGNDNGMLRRIAYAETRDGTRRADASNDGGIWAVSESKFLQTQNIEANVRLPMKLQQIKEAFGIDWLQVEWEDLRMPLYSVIAARLVLYVAPRAIPPANDLQAQARFWVENYNPAGDEDEFIGASSGLQGILNLVSATVLDLVILPRLGLDLILNLECIVT